MAALLKPIGYIHSSRKLKLEAPRQGALDRSGEIARLTLEAGKNFEQALEDLSGFSHLWLISQFHLNETWKAKVKPPRGSSTKRGVFATRSPYRPNPLGLSCVELIEIKGRHLWIKGSDLLDGTPVLDIKPYVSESDSFPQARQGWLIDRSPQYEIVSSPLYNSQMAWLSSRGLETLQSTVVQQLERNPLDSSSKRVRELEPNLAIFSYRTWRVVFRVGAQTIELLEVRSGYSKAELLEPGDQYQDKSLHRDFQVAFRFSLNSSIYSDLAY